MAELSRLLAKQTVRCEGRIAFFTVPSLPKTTNAMSLLEQNARKVAELEEDWRDLGPLRKITFHGRFSENIDLREGCLPAEAAAEGVASLARRAGFESSVGPGEFGDWHVWASKMMQPDVADITELEERFKTFVAEQRGDFDGWSYPSKKEVRFWPDARSNEKAALSRAAVLFGEAPVSDPLKPSGRGFFAKPIPAAWDRFDFVPSEFLSRAESLAPAKPQPTASGFLQWVYSLYAHAHGTDEDREQGKDAEGEILALRMAERRRAASCSTDNAFLRSAQSPWQLMHNGLHIDRDRRPDYFQLPQLRVGGEPLRVSPDLLYVNRREGKVAIVEIKYSQLPIPKTLWPNIWAQLWCYSHIDAAASANDVTVIGEIWGEQWSKGYGQGSKRVDGQKLICLRSSVRRDPRLPAYDRFFRRLFQTYSGH